MSKRNKILLSVIFFLSIGIVAYAAVAESKNSPTAKAIETGESTYYGTIQSGFKMVLNNVWGGTSKELDSKSIQSYIYVKSGGIVGWEWNRPDPEPYSKKYVPPIYPEVVVGSTPAGSSSTTDVFPIRYGDIKDWTSTIKFEYVKSPNGLYNLAYDIYWMNGNTKKFNVMIWIDGHYDGGAPIGEVSDGINTYIHYYKPAGQTSYWEWHAFELKNQGSNNHSVNIKKLLDNAFSPDKINGDWVIPGIELGNEVWKGSGRIQINSYDIIINGDLIS